MDSELEKPCKRVATSAAVTKLSFSGYFDETGGFMPAKRSPNAEQKEDVRDIFLGRSYE
jgi:hypothetical protein